MQSDPESLSTSAPPQLRSSGASVARRNRNPKAVEAVQHAAVTLAELALSRSAHVGRQMERSTPSAGAHYDETRVRAARPALVEQDRNARAGARAVEDVPAATRFAVRRYTALLLLV